MTGTISMGPSAGTGGGSEVSANGHPDQSSSSSGGAEGPGAGGADASIGAGGSGGAGGFPETTLDAGPDSGASTGTGGMDAGPPCGGVVVGGGCWYLGAFDQSCNAVCAAHGGYSSLTASYTGTPDQGGNSANCGRVLTALGISRAVAEGVRSDGLGLACHVWNDGQPWWLSTPAEDPASATSGHTMQRVCACQR